VSALLHDRAPANLPPRRHMVRSGVHGGVASRVVESRLAAVFITARTAAARLCCGQPRSRGRDVTGCTLVCTLQLCCCVLLTTMMKS